VPWGEISSRSTIGVRALASPHWSFLIGNRAELSVALQLKLFGAEIYIIDILGTQHHS